MNLYYNTKSIKKIQKDLNVGVDIVFFQNSNFKKILDQIKSNNVNNIY